LLENFILNFIPDGERLSNLIFAIEHMFDLLEIPTGRRNGMGGIDFRLRLFEVWERIKAV